MYDHFHWTRPSVRRNRLTAEYEPIQPFFLVALAQRANCKTFVDVGANIGAYSIFSTLVPSIQHIIAFEADPDTLLELRSNVRLNKMDHLIQVEGKAVSDATGTVSFAIIGHHSGANSVARTSIHDQSSFQRQVSVPATTLDACLPPDLPGPLCLKVDVEGHEAAVIEGGSKILGTQQALIQIECYDDAGRANAHRLERLGYRRLTAIGPDHYFANIGTLWDPAVAVAAYEQAASEFIAYGHRQTSPAMNLGSLRLEVGGSAGDMLRRIRKRLRGR